MSTGLWTRLAVLACFLMAVVSVISRVHRNPHAFSAFFASFTDANAAAAAEQAAAPTAAPAPASQGRVIETNAAVERNAASQTPPGPPATPEQTPQSQVNPLRLEQIGECTEVDRALLDRVRDKTPARTEENDAIYQLLCVAATTPPEKLASAARHDVFFSNLFNNPDDYRGRPIYIHGVLTRLTVREKLETKNAYALDKFYEAWVFPDDQSVNPVVMLFSKLPDGLKPGVQLKETVSFNAFFMKLFAYQAMDQKWHVAPLLVGYDLHWQKADNEGLGWDALLLGGGFVLLLTIASLCFWRLSRKDDRLADELHAAAGDVRRPDAPFTGLPEEFGASPSSAGDAMDQWKGAQFDQEEGRRDQ